MTELLHQQESCEVIGACFEVYKEMGPGFLEEVYHECLKMELSRKGIPFSSKQGLGLSYKGERLTTTYVPGFICYDKIIVEIKSVSSLADIYRAKVKHYLKMSGLRLGLLVNFCHYPKIEHERIVL